MNYENNELLLLAHKKQIKIHLILKDTSWRNGFVKELSGDFFMFEDPVNGLEPIFYLQVI